MPSKTESQNKPVALRIPKSDKALIAQVETFTKAQRDFKIGDEAGLAVAATLLAEARKKIKLLNERLEEILAPKKAQKRKLDEEMRQLKVPYQVVLDGLKSLADTMSQKVVAFNRALEAKRTREQAEIDAAYEKEQREAIERALATKSRPVIPTHVVVPKTNTYKEFGVQLRKLQTFSIPGVVVDGKEVEGANLTRANPALATIPDEFWVLDLKGLGIAHRNKNCKIEGTEHVVKEITAV